MKKFDKPVSCDSRGQMVIPRDVRRELLIDQGTAFWVFYLKDEGILLKRIDDDEIDYHDASLKEIYEKSEKIGIEKKNITSTIQAYAKKENGGFREI